MLDPSHNPTVLHSFTGGSDGVNPYAGLIMDPAGNLYGTTLLGGTSNYGTVFMLDPSGNPTVLYSFTGASDGANPYAGLIMDQAGNLIGTTSDRGDFGYGTVFMLDPSGNPTVLHSFAAGPNDGARPWAGVIMDQAGNLYGTTQQGGAYYQYGAVYELDPSGNLTVLYSFTNGPDGGRPLGGLIRD
jgi:uncharacterized repeat protein (TIGR03803 family)